VALAHTPTSLVFPEINNGNQLKTLAVGVASHQLQKSSCEYEYSPLLRENLRMWSGQVETAQATVTIWLGIDTLTGNILVITFLAIFNANIFYETELPP